MNKFTQYIIDNWDEVLEFNEKHNEYLATCLKNSEKQKAELIQHIVDNWDEVLEFNEKHNEYLASCLKNS